MPLPTQPSPALKPFLLAIVCLGTPGTPRATPYFAENQVLPTSRTVDLVAWIPAGEAERGAIPALHPPRMGDTALADSLAAAPKAPWECAAGSSSLHLSVCRIFDIGQAPTALDRYLNRTLLNLSASTFRGDLTANTKAQAGIDSLRNPVLALRKRGDSCAYLVVHPEAYEPLAGGRVPCPDLATALSGIEQDLAGRFDRRPRALSRNQKFMRPPGILVAYRPRVIDLAVEASIGIPNLLDSDSEEETGIPGRTIQRRRLDLEDIAGYGGPALSGRAFIQYRKLIGFRFGYEYTRLDLHDAVVADLRSQPGGEGLEAWDIDRTITSGELMLGKGFHSESLDAYLGALLGIAHTRYAETVQIDGVRSRAAGLLKDVTGPTLGCEMQLRFLRHILMGAEAGFQFKEFALKNTETQPDGSAREFQIRFLLGLVHAFDLSGTED